MATKTAKATKPGKKPAQQNRFRISGGWAYFIIGMDATDNYTVSPELPPCTGCGDGSNWPNFVITAKEKTTMHGLASPASKAKTVTHERGIWPPDGEEVGCYMGPDVGGFQSRKEARDWLNLDKNGNPTVGSPGKRRSPEFAFRYETIFITRAITS